MAESRQLLLNESGDMGDLDELFEAFSLFDKDCNGVISKDEIALIMRSISLNPTNEELDDMINEIETDLHEDFKLKKEVEQENKKEVEKENKNDKNKNKKEKKCVARIDFPEFLAFLARKSITDDEDSLKEAFNMFSNESQHIDTDSMIKVLKDLGEPVFREGYEDTVKTLIEQSDIDGDSKISFEEFQDMMKAK